MALPTEVLSGASEGSVNRAYLARESWGHLGFFSLKGSGAKSLALPQFLSRFPFGPCPAYVSFQSYLFTFLHPV